MFCSVRKKPLRRKKKDTVNVRALIIAVVESANIVFDNLSSVEAVEIKGRGKVTLQKRDEKLPNPDREEEPKATTMHISKWREIAAEHTSQGNRIINVARRVKAIARNRSGDSE